MRRAPVILKGNCLDTLKTLPDCSIDSIVTDPPYELGFMGKSWDASSIAYNVEMWAECLRVLKPGGHLLAFSGSRTYHRMTVAIEDAGFEIRDQIAWISNKTFPKSLNVSKAIDKAAGLLEHEASAFTVAGRTDKNLPSPVTKGYEPPKPQSPEAQRWQGWGTGLKPSMEPVVLARKPLEGTVAQNVTTYGTGALNIDGSKVGREIRHNPSNSNDGTTAVTWTQGRETQGRETQGRWPANVLHDGLEEEWAKYFYCAKTTSAERNAGLDKSNPHPTVKPIALMRYLVKLVTPPGGTVLDPFLGSGSTAVAAILEGFEWVGCEMTEDYWPIIEARVQWAQNQPRTLL
jgi:site-specific DNA-methyltransferase (adenine-specific)